MRVTTTWLFATLLAGCDPSSPSSAEAPPQPSAQATETAPTSAPSTSAASTSAPSASAPSASAEPWNPEDDRACRSDDDCVITHHAGCCRPCDCPPARAVNRPAQEAERQRCAAVDCPPAEPCERCYNFGEDVVAYCNAGRCDVRDRPHVPLD